VDDALATVHGLSFARTPSGGQVVDLLALIGRRSQPMITLLRLLPVLCGGHRQLGVDEEIELRERAGFRVIPP
jgi:hypothetical protein